MLNVSLLHVSLIVVTIIFVSTLIIKRFIYFRPSSIMLNPTEPFLDIHEGKLHAWFLKNPNSDKVFLFCHGNALNLSHRQHAIKKLSSLASVLIFDYSGYGLSSGVPNEQLCYSNASTFMEYLQRQGYNKNSIILYGESLGGPVAMYTARRYNLPKVILDSSVSSIKKIMNSRFPFLLPFSFLFPEFNTEIYIKNYNGHVLCVHPENDEVVPISTMSKIAEMSNFVTIPGTHNNHEIPLEIIKKFIDD